MIVYVSYDSNPALKIPDGIKVEHPANYEKIAVVKGLKDARVVNDGLSNVLTYLADDVHINDVVFDVSDSQAKVGVVNALLQVSYGMKYSAWYSGISDADAEKFTPMVRKKNLTRGDKKIYFKDIDSAVEEVMKKK